MNIICFTRTEVFCSLYTREWHLCDTNSKEAKLASSTVIHVIVKTVNVSSEVRSCCYILWTTARIHHRNRVLYICDSSRKKKKRKRSRFVILRAEDARGSVIFKRRYILLNVAVERCCPDRTCSDCKTEVLVDSTHATAESPENHAAHNKELLRCVLRCDERC